MGGYIRDIWNIPKGYGTYIVTIDDDTGVTAERILRERFKNISKDIGAQSFIAHITTGEGMREVESKFKIKDGDKRPILLVMQHHPDSLSKDEKVIKIELGSLTNEDDIRRYLKDLSDFVSEDDFAGIDWVQKKKKILKIASKIPVTVSLISAAAGFVGQ